MSRSWSPRVKQWVALGLIGLGLVILRLLWQFLTPLALALLLTYVLTPIVNFVQRRAEWPRLGATAFVYLILILLLLLLPLTVVPVFVDQVAEIATNLAVIQERLIVWVSSIAPFTIGGFVIEPAQWVDPILSELQRTLPGLVSTSVEVFFGVAAGFVVSLLWLVFILVISFYLVRDSERITTYLWHLVPPDYSEDVARLVQRINATWNSFLRGQLILSAVIAVTVTVVLLILGVPNALLLGLLAGILEMIPNVGPFLSMVPAVLIALFRGSTNWEIANWIFALIVVGAYTLIQQIENNYLVPRIIGGSVNLHPVVILIGAIVGASLAGILGIFLAAPVLASIRIVAGYAYSKLLDFGDVPAAGPKRRVPPAPGRALEKPPPSERPDAEEVPVAASPWQSWIGRWRRRSQNWAFSPMPVSASFDASRIQAILFDLDGTLLAIQGGKSDGHLARRLAFLAPVLPGRDPEPLVRRLFVLSETPVNYCLAVLDRLGLDTWLRPLADRARRAKGIGTSRASTLVPGAREALAALQTHYPLAVLTNRSRAQARNLLAQHALQDSFSAITTRGDLWRFKPHPQAVRHTAARLGVPPESILMVGDMPVDMQTARRAGAQCVGVLTGFATEAELRRAGAGLVLPSVAQLPAVILGWKG